MGFSSGIRTLGFGLCVGTALVVSGGQELLLVAGNKEPLSVSCADLQKNTPRREWIAMSGCAANISAASYFVSEKSGKITDLYIPIYPVNGEEKKTKISLHTTRKDWIDLVSEMKEITDAKGDLQAFYERNSAKLELQGELQGVVESGLDASSNEHAQLRNIDQDLAEGFFVVRLDKKPSMTTGALAVGLGALSGVWGLVFGIRRFRR